MKAAVLEKRGREGLLLRDVAMPTRRPGEVLLRVHAAGLNRVDLYMRDNGSGITHSLPQTMGVEAAGVVVEAEPDSGLKPGQKDVVYSNAFCGACRYCMAGDQPLCLRAHIMGEHRDGGFAEYVSMPARCILPLPGHADLVEAGARVLVTSSSDAKIERALSLGASGGVNYRREKVAKRMLEMTGGEGVDMVIDSVGEASWDDSLRSLWRGGRLVTCGATTGSNPCADLQRLFIRQLEVYGSTGGSIEECRHLIALFAAGGIKPVIDQRFALDDVHAAFDRLERGEQFGKVVITMNP